MRRHLSSLGLIVLGGLACGAPEAVNHPPAAFAGYDRRATLGASIVLDGSLSLDPDGDALTFAWTAQPPTGPRAALGDAAVVRYTPLAEGLYVFFLSVDDGAQRSPPDLITVDVRSQAPSAALAAVAGPSQRIERGATAQLDGRSSTSPAGVELEYRWDVVDWPDGATRGQDFEINVDPASPGLAALAHLNPERVGAFVISLRVSDGLVESDPDYVTVGVDWEGSAVVAEAQPAARFALGDEGAAPVQLEADIFAPAGSSPAEQGTEWWVLTAPSGEACPDAGTRLEENASVEQVAQFTLRLSFASACAGTWLLFVCPQGTAPSCPPGLDPSPACAGPTALTASCCCGLGDRVMMTIEEYAP